MATQKPNGPPPPKKSNLPPEPAPTSKLLGIATVLSREQAIFLDKTRCNRRCCVQVPPKKSEEK